MIDNLPLKEIFLLFLGTLSTYLIWRVQHQKDKIKSIENQLSEKKFEIYSELVYIIFDTMHGEKIEKKKWVIMNYLREFLKSKKICFCMLLTICSVLLQIGRLNYKNQGITELTILKNILN